MIISVNHLTNSYESRFQIQTFQSISSFEHYCLNIHKLVTIHAYFVWCLNNLDIGYTSGDTLYSR